MNEKFLQQEEEFHRYNAQLELKTNALMKEVEKVMAAQETFTLSPSIDHENGKFKSEIGYPGDTGISEESDPTSIKYFNGFGCLSTRSESLNSLRTYGELTNVKSPTENSDDDFAAEKKKSSATAQIIRVLNSKIKILQSEVNSIRSDYRKKVDELQRAQNAVKNLEEEKNKAASQITALKEQNVRYQSSASDSSSKLRHSDAENISLKKEVEKLKKAIKSMALAVDHNSVRMNRALEEVDKLKTALNASNAHAKELQTAARRNADHLTSVIRKLEKQKIEVLHAFRKQVQLVENLKSQKELHDAESMAKTAEKKFLQLLDSVPSSSNSQCSGDLKNS